MFEDDSVSLLPASWRSQEQNKVWWPPKNLTRKVNKLIKEGCQPQHDWMLINCRFLMESVSPIDNLYEAQRLESLALEMSSMSENDAKTVGARRAKRHAMKNLREFSDSEDEDIYNYIVPSPKRAKYEIIADHDRTSKRLNRKLIIR